ncbi:hypothetical protein EJ05DRAFT_127755 [Pseudovirgaria hyperparasitica]|uniref:Uncharacterized protein n=1 Tax=Pseudovirgaria hyperparasitica TaxID=470096 RepID=A0A6A6VZT3_9PEZI|nr:uncharacterized protein EJ05DRAFT_127755 [Pseudovirgaria hyperparasitica]KAF2755254.1 hypothetical protein EJ05DRAFT_127755 [Pseudovirgaria hyperparasitica]
MSKQFVLPIRESYTNSTSISDNVSQIDSPNNVSPVHSKDSIMNQSSFILNAKAIIGFRTSSPRQAQEASPLVSPVGSSNQGTELPPTPPSLNALEMTSGEASHAQAVDTFRGSHIMNNRPLHSTPINQRSPPTPDPSPPRGSSSLHTNVPCPPLRYPSSRAESFQTAREEPWSTNSEASESQHSLARSPSPERYQSPPIGFQEIPQNVSMNSTSGNNTPMQSLASTKSTHEIQVPSNSHSQSSLSIRSIPDREWNTELMRSVTVRRSARPWTPEQRMIVGSAQPTPASSTPWDTSAPRRLERTEKDGDLERPRIDTSGNGDSSCSEYPNEVDPLSKQNLHDGERKRISTASSVSTVVEAMVVVTSPRKLQSLRHAGKNLALRGCNDVPSLSPRAARSHLPSSTSEDIPLHRLIHKRSRIPDRNNRNSSESEASIQSGPTTRIVTQPPTLNADRPQGIRTEKARARTVSTPMKTLYPSPKATDKNIQGYFDIPHRNIEAQASTPGTASPLFRYISPYSQSTPHSQHSSPRLQHKMRNISLPTYHRSPDGLTWPKNDSSPSASNRSQNAHEDAIERAQSAAHAISQHVRSASSPATNGAKLPISPPRGSQSFLDSPAPSERRSPPHSEHTFLHSPALSEKISDHEMSASTRIMSPSSPKRMKRVSVAPAEDLTRPSLDVPNSRVDDNKRTSMASSARTDEHALARHLYAQNTPFSFSQFSTTPDALEVSEATAISIFPHNNDSLLVVQQVARSSTVTGQITSPEPQDTLRATPLVQPALTVEPCTPPLASSENALVDSPLRNPRKPPSPPVIQFIPPTPAEELERELVIEPKRRVSLKEKARRYSDNYIAPIFARSPSKARRTSSNPPHTRIPNITEQDGNLHPFWKPRGFWDGFEDTTDSEDSFEEDDVLPRGGDTSEVTDCEKKLPLGRRLTNGLRGSGGFLKGNSLGIERHGTNKRRHHISGPTNLSGHRREVGNSPVRSTHPALNPLGRIEKRILHTHSNRSMSNASQRMTRWRKVHKIPGLGIHIQYVGFNGMKERIREKKAEKRREAIRQSIGPRLYVEGSGVV